MSLKITYSFSEVFAQHSAAPVLVEGVSQGRCSARSTGADKFIHLVPGGESSRRRPPREKPFSERTPLEGQEIAFPSDSLLHSGFCVYTSSDATPVINQSRPSPSV